jgi:hypothetical protein
MGAGLKCGSVICAMTKLMPGALLGEPPTRGGLEPLTGWK